MRIHRRASVSPPLAVCFALIASACTDRTPLASADNSAPALAALECRANVRAQSVVCAPADIHPTVAGPRATRIIGGQGVYVRLASSNVSYASGVFSFDLTLRNLSNLPFATADGITRHDGGVRAFFHSGPTVTSGAGAISVANATGTTSFTGANQPYFQYGGEIGGVEQGELGPDGVLASAEISSSKKWELAMPATVLEFSFMLYVGTETPVGAISSVAGQVEVAETVEREQFAGDLCKRSAAQQIVSELFGVASNYDQCKQSLAEFLSEEEAPGPSAAQFNHPVSSTVFASVSGDQFGTYGPCWEGGGGPYNRSDHVLAVGRTLDNVRQIDLFGCGEMTLGEAEGTIFFGCPLEGVYIYCLLSRNDGHGNVVWLGVIMNCITEQEFGAELSLRAGIAAQAISYGNSYIMVAPGFDSKYHRRPLDNQTLCFRGHFLRGTELNYYFQGWLAREYGFTQREAIWISLLWKHWHGATLGAERQWAVTSGFQDTRFALHNAQARGREAVEALLEMIHLWPAP